MSLQGHHTLEHLCYSSNMTNVSQFDDSYFSDLSDMMPNYIILSYGIAKIKNLQAAPEKVVLKALKKVF